MDPAPAQPPPRSWAAGARPGRAGSWAVPLGPGPPPLFRVRPLQEPSARRGLSLPGLSLQERVGLFQDSLAASKGPGPQARDRGGHKPKPSGRAWPPSGSEERVPPRRGPALRPSGSGPRAHREQGEAAEETRWGPSMRPGRSVREQVHAYELRLRLSQAPCAAAAPQAAAGLTGAPAAGPQQSRAAWAREQELWPPSKGEGLSGWAQPQGARESSSRALGLGALRAGARVLGLPQAPSEAGRAKVAQAEGAAGEGRPRAGPAGGPFRSHQPRPGPLMSSPLPADSRAPGPPPALPPTPWGLGDSDEDSDSTASSLTTPSEQSQPNGRSFTLSLAELREFGLDGKEASLDEGCSASLNSSLSGVSLIPAQELEQLLEEVKGLGAESLEQPQGIQVVVLHKDEGLGLGFSIAGGSDQHQRVTIHRVFANGLAAQAGTIQPGDEVLSINGHTLTGCSHGEAQRALLRARPARQAIVVLRKRGVDRLANGSPPAPGLRPPPSVPAGATVMPVQLVKGAHGLGFSLAGGLGSLQGSRPLTVKKIFQGGPTDLLRPGDELLQLGEKSLQGLMRLEAWQLIRALPPGPVQLLLRRGKP